MSLNTAGLIAAQHGRWEQGYALIRRALEIALENDKSAEALRAYNNLGDTLDRRDRYEEALAMLTPGLALAAETIPAEMREKLATCAACHGDNGVSPNQEVPSLAAQPDLFTQWQLVYMRDGTRKSFFSSTSAHVRAITSSNCASGTRSG